jgi:hypothetical protein
VKVIATNNVSAVLASEENANYPGDNVLDDYPKHLWKSSTADATAYLDFTVTAGSAVAVFATNATSITVQVLMGIRTAWASGTVWASGTEWYTYTEEPTATYNLASGSVGSGWADYTAQDRNHTVRIIFSPPTGSVCECGVVQIGMPTTFKDPRPTTSEGLREFSDVIELNNGSIYVVDRDDVRTSEVELLLARNDWWALQNTIIKNAIRSNPRAWRLVYNDGVADWEWVVFARLDGRPRADGTRHENYLSVNISLIEVI